MKYWFDTEFIEDGKTIELISIGIVSENDDTYYAELDVDKSRACEWVKENVFPHLDNNPKSRDVVKNEILTFIDDDPKFWAYYCAYDWIAMCQLFGRMIDLPDNWPMYCNDIMQLKQIVPNYKISSKPETAHNALSDAIWTKKMYDEIVKEIALRG